MLLLTLRGTPTLYQGEEIGMRDVPIPPERIRDPWERNVPRLGLGRDPARTPMQWDDGPKAGFTDGEPWLPLSADHRTINAAAQAADPRSLLALYRVLLALRRAEPALSVGGYAPVATAGSEVLAYERWDNAAGRRLLVALNLGGHAHELPTTATAGRQVLVSTHLDRSGEPVGGALHLRPDEGVVIGIPSDEPIVGAAAR
jgi:alpha-glucosidase